MKGYFINYESSYTKDAYINYLVDSQKDIKAYKVDMSDLNNNKYPVIALEKDKKDLLFITNNFIATDETEERRTIETSK